MVIKKIFEGRFDEEVHSDFLKFGRGDYRDKYLLEGKKQSKDWAIKAGAEFSNFFVRRCLEKVNGPTNVKGVIVSTKNLADEISFEVKKVSNFQGVRKIVIETTVTPKEIIDLMNKYPKVFFALSFEGSDFSLKIKPKAPKSGKPSAGKDDEDGPSVDFCSLKTTDKKLVDEVFFDCPDFKEIKVAHDIKVEDIVYPADLGKLSAVEIRELSKKKGVLTRRVLIDGKKTSSEAKFVA